MSADWSPESRSLAMQWTQLHPDGSREDLHFIAHALWEDRHFELPDIGTRKWVRLVDTALPHPRTSRRKARNSPCSRRTLSGHGA